MTLQNSLLHELINKLESFGAPEVLMDCCNSESYEKERLVFNRKFEFRPSIIIFVENAFQISQIVLFANEHPTLITLRLRSGGHDHEGECSGTNVVLLDFSKINHIRVENDKIYEPTKEVFKQLVVGPGARFINIKPVLDIENVGIPHGTCETVAIAGFTMGGGWGPWTRLHGMACESLIGATIVLANGVIETLSYLDDPRSKKGRLLWALRGGGGMSYGIVTELVFKTFALPETSFSFNIKFNQPFKLRKSKKEIQIRKPAIEILKLWENAIKPDNYPNLIGTNLKIETAQLGNNNLPDPNAFLRCQMNGYYGGTEKELQDFIEKVLGEEALKGLSLKQDRFVDTNKISRNYSDTYTWHFESWDRKTTNKIALEHDGPAPHKITSRLAKSNNENDTAGWDNTSREALICSLQSPKIPSESDAKLDHGVHTYLTLGAISGNYYHNYQKNRDLIGSSFPYKDRPFTIQYQTWWNQFLNSDEKHVLTDEQRSKEMIVNRSFVNRAEDWMEDCRDYVIPHTSGAFISFKDASIPTSTYFSTSYKQLMAVKIECSKDPNLLLRTRKTIL